MATKKTKKVQYLGTGRRKTAIARVRLIPGDGNIVINKRTLDEYFPLDTMKLIVNQPLVATGTTDKFDVYVNVYGRRLHRTSRRNPPRHCTRTLRRRQRSIQSNSQKRRLSHS